MDVIKSPIDCMIDEDIPRDTPLEAQMGDMERLRREWEKMCSSADDSETEGGVSVGGADVFRYELRLPVELRWKAALLRSIDRKAFTEGVRNAIKAYIEESFAENLGELRERMGIK